MNQIERGLRSVAIAAAGLSLAATLSCSSQASPTEPPQVDASQAKIQRAASVSVSTPRASRPLRELPPAGSAEPFEVPEPRRNPFTPTGPAQPDPVVQNAVPIVSMPATVHNFLGQGATLGGCTFPKPDGGEPPGCTTRGDPPDTVGAVGPNHYVQLVNSGIGVWDKSGNLVTQPVFTSSLWTGYPETDGNHCGDSPADGGDDGDGVVLYDQLADRWFITQFDITNDINSNSGPSYQCVAVSQTSDPTGPYWLYDFQYAAAVNDYGKFSVWPDGYYASFNEFGGPLGSFLDARVCAYDRASMLKGLPATQQCFTSSQFGFLPGNLDGPIPPPQGEPAFFVNLNTKTGNAVRLYKFHVDWTTPANSTFTGPTSLAVGAFTQLCNGGSCVPQAAPGNPLGSLGDRAMFHLSYRNFGSVESLVFNHSVSANTAGGVRWYEIRSPNGTPSLFQQGTYAPNDGNWRWMGSIAQDEAQDIALGYSISSSSTLPGIAWTGRTAADPSGTMGQAEGSVQAGGGVETGNFSNGQAAQRWGDYSNMLVDPSDDCTFWYTQELYPANGIFNWDTRIASVKMPNCGANEFTLGISPSAQNLPQSSTVNYAVSTAVDAGTAETIALFVQDLPAGVTGAFNPTSVTTGNSSTLTLTASATATLGPATFTVIGKATSAVHAASAQVTVTPPCTPLTSCPAPDDCGTIPDGCGGTVTCGNGCPSPQSCGGGGTANVCGCTPLTTCPAGLNCGTISNGCGGSVSCGSGCTAPQTCGGGGTVNVCGCTPITTCPAGLNCGTIPNGCGGTVSCGPSCTAPQTCGGGGTANVCGCTALTACPAGDNCGSIPDGCGGTVSCGAACTAPQTCGGGGAANVCGCTRLTACPAGDNCGTIPDGCGGTVTCGAACTAPQTCGGGGTANVCGCTPLTACPAGANCGSIPDGCGGTVQCPGECAAPQTCGGGGTANVCGCTPLTACPAGDVCGTVSDTCGGTLNCGTCSGNQSCVSNQCVSPGQDAGPGTGTDGGRSGSGADGGSSTAKAKGCGCGAGDESSSSAFLGLFGLGLLLARRRLHA